MHRYQMLDDALEVMLWTFSVDHAHHLPGVADGTTPETPPLTEAALVELLLVEQWPMNENWAQAAA